MNPRLPLLDQYPRLGAAQPAAGLLSGPTPVEPLAGADGVFIKHDDRTASDYGGNKIRKLDFLLADMRARGRKTALAFGYAGSNFVAATAWHGRKLGLNTIAGLLPQVPADYIADNLSVSLASGARLFVRATQTALIAEAATRAAAAWARDGVAPAWIPPGGSNAIGALGFANAGLELRQQIDAGELPVPRTVLLPFSSMGTVAGLSLGLNLAGIPARIVAVQVVDERHAGRGKLAALLSKLVALCRSHGVRTPDVDALMAFVEIRTEFYGGEYARADSVCKAAIEKFQVATGSRADTAYTGKALACLYADLASSRLSAPSLYWHTLSAQRLPPGVARVGRDAAPARLRHYWDGSPG